MVIRVDMGFAQKNGPTLFVDLWRKTEIAPSRIYVSYSIYFMLDFKYGCLFNDGEFEFFCHSLIQEANNFTRHHWR